MALKKKTNQTKPAKKTETAPAPRGERLPFLKASEIDGKAKFTIKAVRSMEGKFGRQIVIDGLCEGEGRAWTLKPSGSAIVNLINALGVGKTVTLQAVAFQTSDGETAHYIDLVDDEIPF